jgi:hypothetical protein
MYLDRKESILFHLYTVTNSMNLTPLEGHSHLTPQEINELLWNMKFHCRVHESPPPSPLASVLRHESPGHALPPIKFLSAKTAQIWRRYKMILVFLYHLALRFEKQRHRLFCVPVYRNRCLLVSCLTELRYSLNLFNSKF